MATGYKTIKQCIEDYKLYLISKEIEPGRNSGETITSFLRKQINSNLANASKRFKDYLAKNKFTVFDLYLMALHENLDYMHSIDCFLDTMGLEYRKDQKLKKILGSQAFKKGKLPLVEQFLPKKMECKDDLVEFINLNEGIQNYTLKIVCNYLTRKNWKKWVHEARNQRLIQMAGRGWTA